MIKKTEARNEGMSNLIQKSLPLVTLWASRLSLNELKLFDVYLSRINMHDPESRVVTIYKKELEEILGITKISIEQLKKHIYTLMQPLEIYERINGKPVAVFISLLSTLSAVLDDDETGVVQLKMICSTEARKYIFNIENMGYIRYTLEKVTPLKCKYSYHMFTFLESQRFSYKAGKSFKVTLQELKRNLGLTRTEASKEELAEYKEFKRFNDKILKVVQKELEEKINYKFTYKTMKIGRNVTHIWFDLDVFNIMYITSTAREIKENKKIPEQTNMIREKEKYTKYQLKHVMSFNRICNHAHTKQTELENNITTLKDNYSDICPELRGEKPKQPERTSDFEVTADMFNDLRRAIK